MRIFLCVTLMLPWLLAQPMSVASKEPRPPVVAVPAYPAKSKFEPPLAAAARSLAESTAASPPELLTLAEKTDFRETARYAESVALARALEKRSPFVKVLTLGRSPQGRDIIAVIVSKDRAFTPEAARRTGKVIILLQSCIHPGEVDGKEASEMLLRDVVIAKRFASWLDAAILINIPILNVDGHERFSPYQRINQDGPKEMGFRTTATRLNLNRDFIKADAPEMKAWLRFFNAWLPDFFIDNHVTDGADFQYDITIDIPKHQEVWPSVGRWTAERYLPYLNDRMATEGHVIGPYGSFVVAGQSGFPGAPQARVTGFRTSTYTPRFSTGYAAIQSRPGLLVETHSLKSFKTRTWAHYDVMRHSIDAVVRDPQSLRDAVRQADREIAALAGTATPLYLNGVRSDEGVPFTYRGLKSDLKISPLSGSPIRAYRAEKEDIATQLFEKTTTTLSRPVPLAYAIPVEWQEVIERLELHGLKTVRLEQDTEVEAETVHFFDLRFAPAPFEGRFEVGFQCRTVKVRKRLPAGTVIVPLDNRWARVAMNILEPEAPDSLVRWGFLSSIFEQKEYFSDYVFEPIAAEMAERYPELKREFDERVAADAAFAKNPRARLQWWYERSPYYESDKDVYPILRLNRRIW